MSAIFFFFLSPLIKPEKMAEEPSSFMIHEGAGVFIFFAGDGGRNRDVTFKVELTPVRRDLQGGRKWN